MSSCPRRTSPLSREPRGVVAIPALVRRRRPVLARGGPCRSGIGPGRIEELQTGAESKRPLEPNLLRHYVAALGLGHFPLVGRRPGPDHASAWRVLDEFRDDSPWLAECPKPAEPERTWRGACWSAGEAHPGGLGRAPLEGEIAASPRVFGCGETPPSRNGSLGVARRCRSARRFGRRSPCWRKCAARPRSRARGTDMSAREPGPPRWRSALAPAPIWTFLCLGDYAGAKGAVVGFAAVVWTPAGVPDRDACSPAGVGCPVSPAELLGTTAVERISLDSDARARAFGDGSRRSRGFPPSIRARAGTVGSWSRSCSPQPNR